MTNLLTEKEALHLVTRYMDRINTTTPTQEIIDRGDIPILNGFKVKPGKVSDSVFGGYHGNPLLNTGDGTPIRLMFRTNRISTHDIKRGEIPFKDQVLAYNHNFMRKLVEPAIGTSQFEIPGLQMNSTVIAAENLNTIMVEMVLRDYMARSTTSTSLFVHYQNGERVFCGHKLGKGWVANQKLPYLMDTPSTKAERDQSVPPEYLFEHGICTPDEYIQIRNGAIEAYGRVAGFLESKGIILVDTKTEHGRNRDGSIVSQDELYTMDSSRFWLDDDYEASMKEGRDPVSYSKQFARDMSQGDKGYTPEQQRIIAVRYIMGIQNLTGQTFEPDIRDRDKRIAADTNFILGYLMM
ncbi:MAG: phosphoribosylaminoimidazolesuccinocarboxamide synthase [Candidatus Aenigmarchaeota archaeon]|nr:phosphoribosylaminoimidazolesuccinocarboxamide synthase [Candidatus Aenigmarchaeota archaeon]